LGECLFKLFNIRCVFWAITVYEDVWMSNQKCQISKFGNIYIYEK
jgi:hypothetical protein